MKFSLTKRITKLGIVHMTLHFHIKVIQNTKGESWYTPEVDQDFGVPKFYFLMDVTRYRSQNCRLKNVIRNIWVSQFSALEAPWTRGPVSATDPPHSVSESESYSQFRGPQAQTNEPLMICNFSKIGLPWIKPKSCPNLHSTNNHNHNKKLYRPAISRFRKTQIHTFFHLNLSRVAQNLSHFLAHVKTPSS